MLGFVQPAAAVSASAFAALSAREREVLALMAEGLSNTDITDIADRLSISEKTVRNHASNLFDKLGVWSRAQAIVFARTMGSLLEADLKVRTATVAVRAFRSASDGDGE